MPNQSSLNCSSRGHAVSSAAPLKWSPLFAVILAAGSIFTIKPLLAEGAGATNAEPSYVPPVIQAAQSSATNAYRILCVGNSITRHGISIEQLGWDHEAGMAASSEDKDFVHRLAARIQQTMPDRKVELYFQNVNLLIAQGGKINPLPNVNGALIPLPHLVVIQTGEHEGYGKTTEAMAAAYEQALIKPFVDLAPQPLIICAGIWQPMDTGKYGGRELNANEAYGSVCKKYKIPFVSVESLATDPACHGWGKSGGVKWHPNDKGMEGYANLLFEAFRQVKK